MTQIVTRWCHTCQQAKPAADFYPGNTQCTPCKRAASKHYRPRCSHLEETDPAMLRDRFKIDRSILEDS